MKTKQQAKACSLRRSLTNRIAGVVFFGAVTLTSWASAQTTYSGITFPDGDASFADAVVSYSAGVFPSGTSTCNSSDSALGSPDYKSNVTCGGYVSLGQGGSLVLRFDNPLLVASGNSEPDIHIFEVGSAVERFRLEISADNSTWITLGEISGQPSSVDIDAHPSVSSGDTFAYVRLTDLSNTNNGADIDAIGVNPTYPPPTSDAGDDQSVASASTVTLDGTGSSPGVAGLTLTYAWTQLSGPTVSLSSDKVATPSFTAPTIAINGADQALSFNLVVTDSQGRVSSADQVSITVNAPNDAPPTANAGADQSAVSGSLIRLDGSNSFDPDAGDTITYAWQQASGPSVNLSGQTSAKPTFVAPTLAVNDPEVSLIFSLVVTDSYGLSSPADTVTVAVNAPDDTPPTADAGSDQSVLSETQVTLNGSNSFDPDPGDTITYFWQQRSGPTVSLSNAASVLPQFVSPPVAVAAPSTELIFSLVVTDSFGLSSVEDTTVVTVYAPEDAPPVADAGTNQSVASGATVTLDGSGSYDPDEGDTLTYAWTQQSGTTVSLSEPTASKPTFVAPTLLVTDEPTQLIFSLVVTDSFGLVSSADAVAITVNPPNDTPPTADAGPVQLAVVGQTVELDGSASFDPDEGDEITAYNWRQLSGPQVALDASTAVRPKFKAPALSVEDATDALVFELKVVDSKLRESKPARTFVSVVPAKDGDVQAINALSWPGLWGLALLLMAITLGWHRLDLARRN